MKIRINPALISASKLKLLTSIAFGVLIGFQGFSLEPLAVDIKNPGFESSINKGEPIDWLSNGNARVVSDVQKDINKAKNGSHWLSLGPQAKAAQVIDIQSANDAYDRLFVSFAASSIQDSRTNEIRLQVALYESEPKKGWMNGNCVSKVQISDLSNDNRADPNSYVDAYAVLKLGKGFSLNERKTCWLVIENVDKPNSGSAPVTIDNVEVNLAGPPPDQSGLPNILIVFQDDMGYGDASYQNPESRIQTVHLDKLASQGMRLTDAHSAATICGPSRVGLLTGTLPDKLGVHGNFVQGGKGRLGPPTMPEDTPTLATLCRDAGYDTAVIGKWGIPSNWDMRVRDGETRELTAKNVAEVVDFSKPVQNAEMFGFDYRYIYDESRPFLVGETAPYEDNPRPFGWHENGFAVRDILAHSMEELHASYLRAITDRAVRYIQVKAGLRRSDDNQFRIKDQESPFYIHYLTHAPHLPLVPADQFKGMSKAGIYGDFVVNIDYSLGRLMQVLDDCGMSNNTLLVFSSDNGPEHHAYARIQETGHRSMGQLRGLKRDLYEGGHRVPTVVRWPRMIKANSNSDAMVSMTDWYATVAAITGQRPDPSTGLDSVNLMPVLTDKAKQVRKLLLQDSAVGANHRAIRSGPWVYIDAPSGEMNRNRETDWFRAELGVQDAEGNELYNLEDDPRQSQNRILSDPEQARRLKELLEKTWQPGVRSTPPFNH
ncbi:MAG: arylsulfatase [Puniceicoccaceae bacterium]